MSTIEFPNQPHLYIYNRHHQRYNTPELEPLSFYFFGSGSTGNSVYLKESHVLIDLGFPYKRYIDTIPMFWYDCRYVFLTHEHSDHSNPSTLIRLLDLYPHLRFLISQRMFRVITQPAFAHRFNANEERGRERQAELLGKYRNRFHLLNADDKGLRLPTPNGAIIVNPYFVSHENIINVAYQIDTPEHHLIYTSDLDHVFTSANDPNRELSLPMEYSTDGHPMMMQHPFDLMFVEANYDRDILEEALREDPENAHARGNLRHISEQETWQYIQYTLAPHGLFIPLHASSAFGTLVQDLEPEKPEPTTNPKEES